MQIEGQRRIDYWVGLPLCLLLSLFLRLRSWIRPRPASGEHRNVLFIELSEMGALILAAPALRQLEARRGDAVCHIVALRKNVSNLNDLALFDPANVFGLRDESLFAMLVDVFRFVRFCHRRRIDTVIDMELFTRIGSLLSMLSGARARVGFHNYLGEGLSRGDHLTHRVHYNAHCHMSQNFLALVEALDCDPGELPLPKHPIPVPNQLPKHPVSPEEFAHVEGELARCFDRQPAHRLVVVNHDAGPLLPLRNWPEERFGQLVAKLLDWNADVLVVLVGLPGAMEGARRIEQSVSSPRCANLVGRTRSVGDLIQLFHQADLLITNDSGPAHFATLTDIKSIVLFGPETPSLYGPMGKNSVHLYEQLACSPCFTVSNFRNSPCTDNRCLQAIPVEEVFAAARRLLGTVDTGPPKAQH